MAGYVPIGGHDTWVDDGGGPGEAVLLLHGGLSHSGVLADALGPALAGRFRTVAFDRRGHGRTADSAAPLHYPDMVAETIGVLEAVVGEPAHLVGWSDGGIVALLVALERPDLVRRIVVVGANYHYDAFRPADADPAFATAVRSGYGDRSPDGAGHFGAVVRKSFALWTSEPALTIADLARISQPALVVAGDDDQVPLAHTCSLFEALRHGQLAIVPGASHALPLEQPAALARLVVEFLGSPEPPHTLAPMRRAVKGPPTAS